MNSELPPRFAPLPVRPRPCLGESTNSYIRRLARANHLQPSYLHCYLCGPPQWFGRPLLEHLATTAGHSPEALERALADANSLGSTNRPRRRLPRRNPFAWTTAETSQLTDPITGELADLVEDMIGRKLNGRQIWTELMDHHDYLVTYDSIRHYIRYTRPRTASARAESLM